ncbi:hypothetical protein GF374_03515 [Candidatus Woesearchaeota archaeon]|nr:hypothetical protein [Candidatus Woesearchaeota archaeon]
MSEMFDNIFEKIDEQAEDELEFREEEFETKVVHKVGEALGETDLGYWYSAKRKEEDGSTVWEFTSTQAPSIEVKAKVE